MFVVKDRGKLKKTARFRTAFSSLTKKITYIRSKYLQRWRGLRVHRLFRLR